MSLQRPELKKRCDVPLQGENLIVVACASAAGQVIPPTVLFDVKKVPHIWMSGDF